MGFFGNQLINMMISKIKKNNPKITPYLDDIQNGGNTTEILQRAIRNGDITKSQWSQVKPFISKFGSQYGIQVSDEDIKKIENSFNIKQTNNNNFFRF